MDFYTRDLMKTDIEDIHELYSSPKVTQYLTWDIQSYEETEQLIDTILEKSSEWIYNVIVDADTDKVIGSIELIHDKANNSAELSFIVHPEYWEHGIATSMSQTIIKYGFKVLKLNRIWSAIDARNVAGGIVLQKANMKHEAVLRQNIRLEEGYRDTLIFSILKSEF